MFDTEGASHLLVDDSVDADESIEDIIWRSDLPEIVKLATPNYFESRIIDPTEINRLTDPSLNPNNCPTMAERLLERSKILTSAIGRRLSCTVIQLPGAIYTVEVDLERGAIVHWERQSV